MRRIIVLLIASILLSGCVTRDMPPRTRAGVEIGAILGGIAGAIIDCDNPWRGAILGAAGGALVGGIIGDIVEHAAQEAAWRNAPVRYSRTTEEGWREEIVARPKERRGDYRLVSVKYIRDGEVVGEEIKMVPLY